MKRFVSAFFAGLFSLPALLSAADYHPGFSPLGADALPATLKTLADQVSAAANTNESDRIVREWLTAHPASLPFVGNGTVTFLYYDLAHNREAINVSLSADFNGFSSNDMMFRAGNSGLFYKTVKAENPDNAVYSYWIYTTNSSIHVIDPFNAALHYGKPNRSVVRLPDSPSGTLFVFPGMKPADVNAKRSVYVWLPPKYFAETNRRYPVLYMHDGQQIWDSEASAKGGWKVDTTAEKLINEGKIRPMIIVGVENSAQRPEEFTGFSAFYGLDVAVNTNLVKRGLDYSDGYRNFVVKEIKPWVDRTWRTLPDRNDTFLAGSSFGAVVSLYIGFSESSVFSGIGSFSGGNYPAADIMKEKKASFSRSPYLIDKVIHRTNAMRVYLDCGNQDLDAVFRPRTEDMHAALQKLGYADGKDMFFQIDPKAGHEEPQWAKRFPDFLLFMFGREAK